MEEYYAHLREDGKAQTVREHLTGTAALAARFAEAFEAGPAGQLCGLLHDIGKYSAAFQQRIRDPEHTPKVDHSTAGAQQAALGGFPPAAFAIAGHHAGLPDGGSRPDTAQAASLMGRLKKSVPPYEDWRQEITVAPVTLPRYLNRDALTDAFFTRMLYSCLVDADYLDTERFMQDGDIPRGGYESIAALLQKVRTKAQGWLDAPPGPPLNQSRNEILRACIEQGRHRPQGLYTLAVPTGGGKTFASLAFALEHAAARGLDRVVYVIPYTSIIDQTVEVFRSVLGEQNVLAHYAGADYQLSEKEELSPENYRRALAAENWDAPVIVTTAVQFFESLYANRSARCRKLHNLARSVLVFDEAQTLPVPYLRPCLSAVTQLVQHYHATAVLCTATQPALEPLLKNLAPELLPLREICPGGEALYKAFRRTRLEEAGTIPKEELCRRLREAQEVLCVVNRRKTAQLIYESLPEEGRFCLTTLLCAADRKQQLQEIRRRLQDGQPCRVVSTSLIEAGVDVDFPTAYREAAGLDSVLQTAGRCNREGKRPAEESAVWMFSLAETPPPALLAQNIAALQAARRSGADLDLPQSIHSYFDTLFYKYKSEQALDRKGILPALAGTRNGAVFPFAAVAEEFKLMETPTRPIYLPVGPGAALCARLQYGERSKSLYRALGVYQVAVYPSHFEALYKAGALTVPDEQTAILTDLNRYNSRTGLTMEVENGEGWYV